MENSKFCMILSVLLIFCVFVAFALQASVYILLLLMFVGIMLTLWAIVFAVKEGQE